MAGNVSRKYPAKLPRYNEIMGNDRKKLKQCNCKENGKEREDTLNDGVVQGSIIKER